MQDCSLPLPFSHLSLLAGCCCLIMSAAPHGTPSGRLRLSKCTLLYCRPLTSLQTLCLQGMRINIAALPKTITHLQLVVCDVGTRLRRLLLGKDPRARAVHWGSGPHDDVVVFGRFCLRASTLASLGFNIHVSEDQRFLGFGAPLA